MDKMIIVLFNSERQAYEGACTLRDLHEEGTITMYGEAVIAREVNGNVEIKQAADEGPLGTSVGMVTGALVGLLGGPIGVALGAGVGAVGGSLVDVGNLAVGGDFLNEAANELGPGMAAVVAEIDEDWVLPLDARMEAAGGTVLRRTRGDVIDAQIARDLAAFRADVAALDAEADRSAGEAKAKLQARIDAANAKVQQTQDRARAAVDAARREADAKVAALKDQAARARDVPKQELEKRRAAVEANLEERKAKLEQAGQLQKDAEELQKEARELTVQALKP